VRPETSPGTAIDARGLRRSYGDKVVLDGIDLRVTEGSVFALLGPNGAGKTTTVQVLSTLIDADAGEATVAGHDLVRERRAVRSAIGVTGQFSAVDDLLTGRENLELMADLRHLPRADRRRRPAELLERFDLVDAADRSASTYSGGMRRRLDLAMCLIGDPRLIFLDEPTTGLDPRSRRVMWTIVQELVDAGVTIFLTTQYLEEADQLADQVAVLDGGRLVAQGSPGELKQRIPGGHLSIRCRFTEQVHLAVAQLDGARVEDDTLVVPVASDGGVRAHQVRAALDLLDRAGVEIDDFSIHTPDLDDVFLALTERSGGDRANTVKVLVR
jgi:ABC-2 type transport system ATP-binding protein